MEENVMESTVETEEVFEEPFESNEIQDQEPGQDKPKGPSVGAVVAGAAIGIGVCAVPRVIGWAKRKWSEYQEFKEWKKSQPDEPIEAEEVEVDGVPVDGKGHARKARVSA